MLKKSLSYLGWSIIGFISFYYVYNNALRYFNYSSAAAYTKDLKPFASALIFHVSGGILALLLGPSQFIGRLRKTRPRVHRAIGKVYLTAILLSALASLYLSIGFSILEKHMVAFGTGLIGLALAWLCTSAMAYVAIRRRNFVQHREWMVRSYVVTFGFVSFRIIFEQLTKNYAVDFQEAAALTAWACWALPLLVTEMVLQGRKLKKTTPKAINKEGHTVIITPMEESRQV